MSSVLGLLLLVACRDQQETKLRAIDSHSGGTPSSADANKALATCFSSDSFNNVSSVLGSSSSEVMAVSESFASVLDRHGYTWEQFKSGAVTVDLVAYAYQANGFYADNASQYGFMLVFNTEGDTEDTPYTDVIQSKIDANKDEFNNIDSNSVPLQNLVATEDWDAAACRVEVEGMESSSLTTQYAAEMQVYNKGNLEAAFSASLRIESGRDELEFTVNDEKATLEQESDDAENLEIAMATVTEESASGILYYLGKNLDSENVNVLKVIRLVPASAD